MQKWKIWTALMLYAAAGACAAPPEGNKWILASLDQPPCWYVDSLGKVDQRLRWDEDSRRLVLDLIYGRDIFANGSDPSSVERFTLSFPDVQTDGRGRLFARMDGRTIQLGQLARGILGNHVKLARGVVVDAHRRNGKICAALVVSPASGDH